MSGDPHAILLFDGVCNLCNTTVNFILDRDRAGYFRFAALQSDAAATVLRACGHEAVAGDPDSVILIEDGRVHERSDAMLRVVRHLGGAWPLLSLFLLVPKAVRDTVYRWIARNRYRWFGRSEQCRVPTPELRERFLG